MSAAPRPPGVVVVAAVVLLVVTGGLHLQITPATLEEETWVGVLTGLGGASMLAAAVVLAVPAAARLRGLVAVLAALAAVGMTVFGVLSRTTGLPEDYRYGWSAFFVVSLVLQVATVVAMVPFVRRRRTRR
ncbi:hypothetical protein [Pseudokineococcus sp. 1T1Z-3]|uniref:hypothetical protein n=1 Tax=Pseudokineococcus sp. 1T1Z-3 TaxID=3132745 RepID=UPI00309E5065